MAGRCNDHDGYYRDGYCGGNELPTDLDLDEMLYPEREQPPTFRPMTAMETFDEYLERCRQEDAAAERAEYKASRSLTISEASAQGFRLAPKA